MTCNIMLHVRLYTRFFYKEPYALLWAW